MHREEKPSRQYLGRLNFSVHVMKIGSFWKRRGTYSHSMHEIVNGEMTLSPTLSDLYDSGRCSGA